MTAPALSPRPRQQEVLEAICTALEEGRRDNGNWSFPTDCLCHDLEATGWHYEYDEGFLQALRGVIRAFAATYRREESFE